MFTLKLKYCIDFSGRGGGGGRHGRTRDRRFLIFFLVSKKPGWESKIFPTISILQIKIKGFEMKILYFFSNKSDRKACLLMERVIIIFLLFQIQNYSALKANSKWHIKADVLSQEQGTSVLQKKAGLPKRQWCLTGVLAKPERTKNLSKWRWFY